MIRPVTCLLLAALASSLAFPAGAAAKSHHQSAPYIVVLDAGHGGSDSGATDAGGTLAERTLTLEVAKGAAADLKLHGYTVYVDRTRNQAVNTPPRDLNHDGKIDRVDEFNARALFANHHHADVFVAIHFDASPVTDIHGTHGYYCPARPFWHKSKYLATVLTYHIADQIQRAGYNSPDNGVESDVADIVPQQWPDYPWFLVLGPSRPHRVIATAMPGALIESLYLTNPGDATALHRRSVINAIARGYSQGIQAYFNWKSHR